MLFAVTAGSNVRLAGLAALALLIGLWWMRSFAPAAPGVAPTPDGQMAATEQPALLDPNKAEREAAPARSGELAAEAARRRNRRTRLSLRAATPPSGAVSATAGAEPSGAGAPTPGSARSRNWERWFDAADFDESELLAGGMPSGEVERLSRLSDEIERERTGLTDRAEQEGWLDERRYRDEMVEFESATRQKIGEESYDALLYATGRENRVRVRTLLDNSAGASFGLQEGDTLLRYDDQLIIRATDLRKVTSQGTRGEAVPLEVLRNNQVVTLEGPRGRLGARFQPTRVLPDRSW